MWTNPAWANFAVTGAESCCGASVTRLRSAEGFVLKWGANRLGDAVRKTPFRYST